MMADQTDVKLLSIAAARERVMKYTLMSVEEVAEHYQVSRSTVDQMPVEILPYVDLAPTPKRQHQEVPSARRAGGAGAPPDLAREDGD